MDSLQASYQDDDAQETLPHNNDAEERKSANDSTPELKSFPVDEGAHGVQYEPQSEPTVPHSVSESTVQEPDSRNDAVLEAQRELLVSYSIAEDTAAQEPEPQNDAAQEAQPDTTMPNSISKSAAQKPDSRNDAALEAQHEHMVSDSLTLDVAVQETEPHNITAQDAKHEPMVTDSVSEEDAEEAEPQNHAVRKAQHDIQPEPIFSESVSEDDPTASDDTQKSPKPDNFAAQNDDVDEEEDEDDDPPPKKQKPLSLLTTLLEQQPQDQQQQTPVANDSLISQTNLMPPSGTTTKKSKKKNHNVWVPRTTRKGKKKNKPNTQKEVTPEETVLIMPVPRFPDKGDDNPEMKICLSKVYKAEKVELSEDRLTAGSTKGYRMVRATRGVGEGAWYYEIKVVSLGETGHTRLGWSTEKGDLQAPVGYDGNSFGYRDIDGSKVHKALLERYAEEGYKEGDVIGFYINLPEGGQYAPKPPHFVWYKGQRYVCAPDAKEDPPKVVPGSEISFFKNGVCQGAAFKDLYGGRYYPAASMYTLPNQPNCVVKFNFGPDFECFPEDFGERPLPSPMAEVPYHGFDSRVENGVSNEKKH